MSDRILREFLRALDVVDVPCPEVSLDNDGDFCLEWQKAKDRVVTVSISEQGRIAFAFLLCSENGHGAFDFDGKSLPKPILDALQSLYG